MFALNSTFIVPGLLVNADVVVTVFVKVKVTVDGAVAVFINSGAPAVG
jgi:hypothetical protein